MQHGYALAQGAQGTEASKAWPPAVAAQDNSDESLLERIAAGDQLAMRTLYARHSVKAYRFVLRLVGDARKAEDIVSEVFFDVWRQAGRFEGRSQVGTWILAIARFKALTARRARRDEPLDHAMAENIADGADDPEACLQKKDERALLRACIAQLSGDHRAVIDLVYYHGKSVEEAAEILGVPRNTVKTRMFYARKRIGELYAGTGGARVYHA
jgi:RNA polymerase sigma-70 factor (ECF subfamily)